MYINRLKSYLRLDIYVSENFEKIDNDEEFNTIYNIVREYGIDL